MKKVVNKKIKNTTLDDLARIMQEGFAEMVTRAEFNARFEQVDARFEQVDARFNQVDAQFEQNNKQHEEMKSELWYVRNHIDLIEKEINSIKVDLKNVARTHEVEGLELRVAILEKLVKGMMKK